MQRNFIANEWGVFYWKTMHFTAHSYPDKPTKKQKADYYSFFKSFCTVLPCSLCRRSYCEYFKRLPIKKFMGKREHLVYWVYIIHRRVNRKLKKCNLLKFKTAVKMYEKHRARSTRVMRIDEGDIPKKLRMRATCFLFKKKNI